MSARQQSPAPPTAVDVVELIEWVAIHLHQSNRPGEQQRTREQLAVALNQLIDSRIRKAQAEQKTR